MSKGQKISEKVIILSVSRAVSKPNTPEEKRLIVLHTTKCKTMRTKKDEPVERFTFTEKQWNNFVNASGQPAFIYEKQIIGGTYAIDSQFVEEGDAFLQGEGTYHTAHFARVSESITKSNAAIARDEAAALSAYYAYEVSKGQNSQVATAVVTQPVKADESIDDMPV